MKIDQPPARLAELNPAFVAPPELATLGDDPCPTITLEDLRRASTRTPAPPLKTEPTEAHDLAVQAALYSRAVGYTRTKQVLDREGVPTDIREELPPDPGAAKAWLMARRPDKWGEKPPQALRVVIDRMGDGRERIAVGLGDEVHVIEHDGAK